MSAHARDGEADELSIDLAPAPGPSALAAVRQAAARIGVSMSALPPGYASAWRRAGLDEGVGRGRPIVPGALGASAQKLRGDARVVES